MSSNKQILSLDEARPFPWKCASCGQRSVQVTTEPYTTTVVHDGREYEVKLPELTALRCASCHAVVLDDAAGRQISNAFRIQAKLLTPEQIRANRERLRLTQKQLAAHLGIAVETQSRWETGAQVQQRVLDRMMRLYFGIEVARMALADDCMMETLGVVDAQLDACESNHESTVEDHEIDEVLVEVYDALQSTVTIYFHKLLDEKPGDARRQLVTQRFSERKAGMANAFYPAFRWCILSDSNAFTNWYSCFDPPSRTVPTADDPKLWLVVPRGYPVEAGRAGIYSKVAAGLDRLPNSQLGIAASMMNGMVHWISSESDCDQLAVGLDPLTSTNRIAGRLEGGPRRRAPQD